MNSAKDCAKRKSALFRCILLLLTACLFCPLSACMKSGVVEIPAETAGNEDSLFPDAASETELSADKTESVSNDSSEDGIMTELAIFIGDQRLSVVWEENDSVRALKELAAEPLTVKMSMYGGFEQVGSLGSSLPRDDAQITTRAGDIVLYSGSQIVIFYGSNSWAYTRLGRMKDISASALKELFGNGDVTLTIAAEV